MDPIRQFAASQARFPGNAHHAEQMPPQSGHLASSPPSPPPPGLEDIRARMYPAQTTDDFAVFNPPASSKQQSGRAQIRFQVNEPIAADAVVKDKRNLELVYHPNDGPIGFGYYKENDHDPSIINFYPVTGLAEHPQGRQPRTPSVGGHGKRARPRIAPFTNDRPSSSPPPVIIDPNWIAWWEDTQKIDPSKHPDWIRRLMIEDRIDPMMDYINRFDGPQAAKYKEALIQKGKELSPDPVEPPKDEAWFAERRGMLGREEYMKPVSYLDGVTDWRKDPYYKAKQREEERERGEAGE